MWRLTYRAILGFPNIRKPSRRRSWFQPATISSQLREERSFFVMHRHRWLLPVHQQEDSANQWLIKVGVYFLSKCFLQNPSNLTFPCLKSCNDKALESCWDWCAPILVKTLRWFCILEASIRPCLFREIPQFSKCFLKLSKRLRSFNKATPKTPLIPPFAFNLFML